LNELEAEPPGSKKCGREPGGAISSELGVCPAAIEKKPDGTHGGSNAGRACWVVAGTLCDGIVQGTFSKKYENCEKCDFFHQVLEEEDKEFTLHHILPRKLRER
jgi:hypothetical protein